MRKITQRSRDRERETGKERHRDGDTERYRDTNLFKDRDRQTEMHLHSDAPTQREKQTKMRGVIQIDRKGNRTLGSRKNRQADRQREEIET